MTPERYRQADASGTITASEIDNGWHFCMELDGALVNCEHTYRFCNCLGSQWLYQIASAYGPPSGDDDILLEDF